QRPAVTKRPRCVCARTRATAGAGAARRRHRRLEMDADRGGCLAAARGRLGRLPVRARRCRSIVMPANDAALASLLLTNRLVDTGARSLTASEFWPLIERVGDPATLLGRSAADLNSVVDGDEDRAARLAALLDAGSALA